MSDHKATKSKTTAPFQTLGRDVLVEQVTAQLSDAIIGGSLKPGARLSESVIAREMGVSRAPVREAARLLESSGLVAYQPNRGFFVRKITAAELDDLYDLRITIEVAAAQRLAREGADTDIHALSRQQQLLRDLCAASAPMQEQVKADMEFHRMMIRASGNPRFLQVFDQIAQETELSIAIIGSLYSDPSVIAESHAPILDALIARDAGECASAITEHLELARRMVTAQYRQIEDG